MEDHYFKYIKKVLAFYENDLSNGFENGISQEGKTGEMLFYTSLIYDICIAKKPLFSFGKYGTVPNTSHTIAIRNGGKKLYRLIAHMLAEKYHPLFTEHVVGFIRDSLASLNIGYDWATSRRGS